MRLVILLKAQSLRFVTGTPTFLFFKCFLSCSMSAVIDSLFIKCTLGYEQRYNNIIILALLGSLVTILLFG